MSYPELIKTLKRLGSPERARASAWFFKTGPGEYGEGDKFLGITVPVQRKVATKFKDLSFADIRELLKSPVHEHRFTGLVILVAQYREGDEARKKRVVDFYLANTRYVNNWDLVDTSAPYILGDRLLSKDKSVLYKLARSKNIWERRISIISTLTFIKNGNYDDTLKIAGIFLKDEHDLIQKAAGWALREVGKKSVRAELEFLDKYYRVMPRTMLRYAIEKFSKEKREHYLKK